MTAVVGSAAEDTTPSEREAPARFAWWHPQSADLGRRAEARRQHARRNDLWARPTACEAPIIPRPLPPRSTSAVFAVIDGPVFAPVDPPTPHALAYGQWPPQAPQDCVLVTDLFQREENSGIGLDCHSCLLQCEVRPRRSTKQARHLPGLASSMDTLVLSLEAPLAQGRVEVTTGSRSNALHQFLLQQCDALNTRRETA